MSKMTPDEIMKRAEHWRAIGLGMNDAKEVGNDLLVFSRELARMVFDLQAEVEALKALVPPAKRKG